MEKQPNIPSPEEQAKIQRSRTLSDAELIKGGADYVPTEGSDMRLEVTPEQIKKIREDSPEEFEIQNEKIFGAYEKEIEDFISSFDTENPTKENLKKLVEYLDTTGENDKDGGRRYRGINLAEKVGIPFDMESTNGVKFFSNKIKNAAKNVSGRLDDKLVDLAYGVVSKQFYKLESEGNTYELCRLIDEGSVYPNRTVSDLGYDYIRWFRYDLNEKSKSRFFKIYYFLKRLSAESFR